MADREIRIVSVGEREPQFVLVEVSRDATGELLDFNSDDLVFYSLDELRAAVALPVLEDIAFATIKAARARRDRELEALRIAATGTKDAEEAKRKGRLWVEGKLDPDDPWLQGRN